MLGAFKYISPFANITIEVIITSCTPIWCRLSVFLYVFSDVMMSCEKALFFSMS